MTCTSDQRSQTGPKEERRPAQGREPHRDGAGPRTQASELECLSRSQKSLTMSVKDRICENVPFLFIFTSCFHSLAPLSSNHALYSYFMQNSEHLEFPVNC